MAIEKKKSETKLDHEGHRNYRNQMRYNRDTLRDLSKMALKLEQQRAAYGQVPVKQDVNDAEALQELIQDIGMFLEVRINDGPAS